MASLMALLPPITLQNPLVLWWLLPLLWLLLVFIAWRRRFKPFGAFLLRLTILVLVSLALAQPVIISPDMIEPEPPERVVILVDQSASLGTAGQQALRDEAARLVTSSEDATVLYFTDQTVSVINPTQPITAEFEGLLDPEISNLAQALRLGSQLLSSNGQPQRLMLLSDGVPTLTSGSADVVAVAEQLAQQNIPVDPLLPTRQDVLDWHAGNNEVRLVNLIVPPVLRRGQEFEIEVDIYSDTPVKASLTVTEDEGLLQQGTVTLAQGHNHFNFTATALTEGMHTYQATIAADAGDDYHPQNNSYAAVTQVYPPPKVLVVTDGEAEAYHFIRLMRNAGVEAEAVSPSSLPSHLSELDPYAGMVLLNVPANVLTLEQMIAVQEFVRSLGRGLVISGGPDSYILGNYADTPLLTVSPLSLEPPPREERPPVAFLLVIDHSGSMLERGEGRSAPTRLAMAKEAAVRATEILGPKDLVGVLMFDNNYEWTIPFQPVSAGADLLQIQETILRIPAGGGTSILPALEAGILDLIDEKTAAARHVVLLSDGKSFDGLRGREDYDLLVDQAVENNITLSTVAIGNDADAELMAHLAERGGGRYHFAAVPEDLPAITVAEGEILRSNVLQEGDFATAVFAPHPMVRGLFSPTPQENRGPPLNIKTYLAMSPKPEAEVALQVGPGDPLLASWGYGLGRVAAWSSDIGLDWASPWRTWPNAARFWAQVVGYTLPAPDLPGGLQLQAQVGQNGAVTLVADSLTATGMPVDLSPPRVILFTPTGQETTLTLRQVAPGRYEAKLLLPDVGAYQVTAVQRRTDQPDASVTMGFVVPYPDEYAVPPEGTGSALLEQIATISGGTTFRLGTQTRVDPLTANPETEAPPDQPLELWPWLLLLALILWPFEIAWRRWSRLRIQ